MKAVIRKYSGKGAKELFDAQHAAELQSIMRSVKGFLSYTLARHGDGGFSVTVCEDQAGIDESAQKAKRLDRAERRQHWCRCSGSIR